MEAPQRYVATFKKTHRADGQIVIDCPDIKHFVLVGREEFLQQILIPTVEEFMYRTTKLKVMGKFVVGMNVYFQQPTDYLYVVLETIPKPNNG